MGALADGETGMGALAGGETSLVALSSRKAFTGINVVRGIGDVVIEGATLAGGETWAFTVEASAFTVEAPVVYGVLGDVLTEGATLAGGETWAFTFIIPAVEDICKVNNSKSK